MGILLNQGEVKERVALIREFQESIHRLLQEGRDWGSYNPRNPQKKILLKPGAEVLKHLLNLTDKYTLMAGPTTHDGMSHEFLFQCTLVTAEGEPVAEGVGYSSTGDAVYRNTDRYAAANSSAKMAKKRALVDAILSAACLSGQFDQDLDDEDPQVARGVRPQQVQQAHPPRQPAAVGGRTCPTHQDATWRINKNGGEYHILDNNDFCNPHSAYRPLVEKAVKIAGIKNHQVTLLCEERFKRPYVQLSSANCEELIEAIHSMVANVSNDAPQLDENAIPV